jgi:hypothetical protein
MSSYSAADDWFDPSPPPGPRSRKARRRRDGRSALAPLLIGSALAIVAIAGQSKLGSWLRGFFSTRTKALPPQSALLARVEKGLPLPLLRDSILGRRKVAVADLLGAPRTAVITRPTMGAVGQAAFWRADTWYYAIDSATQTAMAVMFDAHGMASEVDFFDAPQPPGDLPAAS